MLMRKSLSLIFWVYRKELREILRNRRALLEMLFIPFFMTPILTLVVPFVITAISSHYLQEQIVETIPKNPAKVGRRSQARILLLGEKEGPRLSRFFREKTTLQVVHAPNAREALLEQKVQGAVVIRPGFEKKLLAGKEAKLKVIVMPVNIKNIVAYLKIKAALENYFSRVKEEQKKRVERGLHYRVDVGTIASKRRIAGFVLSLITPTFFLFWMMMGGNSIAIDVTAGEKERRTLEGMLVLPLQRWHILLGKFGITATIGLTSALLATAGMALPMALFFQRLPPSWRPYLASYLPGFWQVGGLLGALCLLGLVLSSIQVFLGFLSRSVKEAEYFLYPLVLPIVVPSVLAIFLELSELKGFVFLVPILSNALCIREAVADTIQGSHFFIAAWSSFCTALFFLYLAWEILSHDRVLATMR